MKNIKDANIPFQHKMGKNGQATTFNPGKDGYFGSNNCFLLTKIKLQINLKE